MWRRDHVRAAAPESPRRRDELQLAELEHRSPGDPRVDGDRHDADGQERVPEPGSDHGHDGDRQERPRKRQQDVHAEHDDEVGRPPDVARHEAEQRPDRRRHDHGADPEAERHSRRVDDPHQVVAPEGVRAEGMRAAGRLGAARSGSSPSWDRSGARTGREPRPGRTRTRSPDPRAPPGSTGAGATPPPPGSVREPRAP